MWKITIMWRSAAAVYVHRCSSAAATSHKREFQKLSPNGRMPAIPSIAPRERRRAGGEFEEGAILIILAERTENSWRKAMGRGFEGDAVAGRCGRWAGWGRCSGDQNGNLAVCAGADSYAIDLLYPRGKRLTACSIGKSSVKGEPSPEHNSIRRQACFPWIRTHKAQGADAGRVSHSQSWFALMRASQLQAGLRSAQSGEGRR